MTNRCPPSHVLRLLALDCPIKEITRITGYTEHEIAAMRRQDAALRAERRRLDRLIPPAID
jgi:hypothetical protein